MRVPVIPCMPKTPASGHLGRGRGRTQTDPAGAAHSSVWPRTLGQGQQCRARDTAPATDRPVSLCEAVTQAHLVFPVRAPIFPSAPRTDPSRQSLGTPSLVGGGAGRPLQGSRCPTLAEGALPWGTVDRQRSGCASPQAPARHPRRQSGKGGDEGEPCDLNVPYTSVALIYLSDQLSIQKELKSHHRFHSLRPISVSGFTGAARQAGIVLQSSTGDLGPWGSPPRPCCQEGARIGGSTQVFPTPASIQPWLPRL